MNSIDKNKQEYKKLTECKKFMKTEKYLNPYALRLKWKKNV